MLLSWVDTLIVSLKGSAFWRKIWDDLRTAAVLSINSSRQPDFRCFWTALSKELPMSARSWGINSLEHRSA